MASYLPVPEWERKVLRWFYSNRDYFWATRSVQRLVSPRPLHDLCVYTNVFGLLGLVIFGRPLFWALCATYLALTVAPTLVLLKTRRPEQVEPHILPLARTSEALVCSDCFVAAVVAASFAIRTDSHVAAFAFAFLALLVGFSRLVACCKYVHQVCGGLMCGCAIVFLAQNWPNHLRLSTRNEWVAITLLGLLATIVTMLQIENNEHPYIGIPRKEYLRVLNNIMMQDTTNVDPQMTQKDSFVLMINQMHRRARRRREREMNSEK